MPAGGMNLAELSLELQKLGFPKMQNTWRQFAEKYWNRFVREEG